METRASIPVALPRSNPTTSYWQDPPDAQVSDYLSSPTVPETADVVIIGSGITGAGIAWNLLNGDDDSPKGSGSGNKMGEKKKEKIVMLEARQACSGATGRNGGHTKAASYRTFLANSAISLSTAKKIARFEYATIKAVHAFAATHNIDCDSWTGDTVDIVYDQGQWEASLKGIEAIRSAFKGEEDEETVGRYRVWSASEAREKWLVDSKDVVGAVSYEAGSLSAYKFVTGVLKLCLERGLELFTNTPALKVQRGDDGLWSVETERGLVKAKKVVLATNGYTAFLHGGFQGSIVPLRGQVTAQRPGANMPSGGLPGTYSFIYGNGYEYMIPRPRGSKYEGDIVIGGGLVKADQEGLFEFGEMDDGALNVKISGYLRETTARYFGDNWGEDDREGRVRREWTGVMGYSSDGFPFVGEIPGEGNEGLWVCASFQGHGMVLCWLCGQAIVGMINGRYEELEWFPDVFRVSSERMERRFEGRLNTKVSEVDGSS
ncbi:FAD dependent oxidoreductase [Rhexocercosporidium sp. MPI-PUGE-AT-0058]|nr:FAD dependent oxidoreductase [Rhexocercosporidium sp. MPI-PUGE-AT-0058]